MVFDGYLRQQQAAAVPGNDQQSMLANFDLVGGNGVRFRQHRNFDLEFAQFLRAQRRKTRVMKGGALRAVRNADAQRFAPLDHADAAAKFSRYVDRYKDAAPQGEVGRLGLEQ